MEKKLRSKGKVEDNMICTISCSATSEATLTNRNQIANTGTFKVSREKKFFT